MNLSLNTEQRAALDSLKAAHKQQTNLDLTDDEYIAAVMIGLINEEAGGDTAKLQSAIEAGKQAALDAIA